MRQRRATSNPYSKIKRTNGKRSGLEVEVARVLSVVYAAMLGKGFDEEKDLKPIPYTQSKDRKYHPDFRLHNGILIEAKGWFKSSDRQKHLAIKYQHPQLDIRFIFSNPNNKIGKKSNTTYAMWCEKNGFKYCGIKAPLLGQWALEGKE